MKLQEFLKKEGRNQAWLARELAVTKSAVSMWIGGQRVPKPETLMQIEEITKGKVKLKDFMVG